MTPETRLANQIRLQCGKLNWLCYHCLNGLFYSRNGMPIQLDFPVGFPDLLIITDCGKCAFIETKIHPRKPTSEQLKFQSELRSRGFVSETVYSIEDFEAVIKQLVQAGKQTS